MRNYFCGWYYRCQSDQHTLAVIPSIHRTEDSDFCTIQLITDTGAFYVQFPNSDFQKDGTRICIGKNRFDEDGIHLDIQTSDFHAAGHLRFGPFTPLKYDIMGPFQYVPLMQCRHTVYSMQHKVDGTLSVNGVPYVFQNATGYLEGDRGRSFPKDYIWTYCSVPNGAVMLSVADIPLGFFHFTGVIGVVLLDGKEYRLATYLGAKAIKIQPDEIAIQQGLLRLTVRRSTAQGHPLCAPISGAMTRTIHEHPSCEVHYRFEEDGSRLLDYDATNAAFEYEY